MINLRMRQGKRGLELIGKNLTVEEGSPKFNELMSREGKGVNIQIDEQPKQRMAGDELTPELEAGIDQQITEILYGGNDYAKENRAQTKRVAEQLARYARHDASFERAGVPTQAIGALLDDKMSNGMPMPYVDTVSKPNVERRVHTNEVINKYTGELETVPFMDGPEVMVSEFGDGRKGNIDGFTPSPEEKATEYVAERVLKLMGIKPVRGPHKGVDFQDPDRGMMGIDAQIQRGSSKFDTQLYTLLKPRFERYQSGNKADQQRIIRDVKTMIKQKGGSDMDVIQAVEMLNNDQQFWRPRIERGDSPEEIKSKKDIRLGKALKDSYHEVLMPQYPKEFANRNQKARDSITEAPDDINLVDLSKALTSVKGMSAQEAIDRGVARVSWNQGNSGDGMLRARINVDTPQNAVTNVVDEYPLTAQMLKKLK